MCGICGVIDQQGVTPAIVARMRDTLTHRGPDDAGAYLNPDCTVGLGHRRLSIIDLSAMGHQPMQNETGAVQIIFNGEFYSYRDFIPELKNKGHIFRSNSDTEVIIHLYEEYGLDFVQKLRGMFAIGLWDESRKRLVLARDRVGIKPLYYTVVNGFLAFSSEIKALLTHPKVSKEINFKALNEYFALGYIPGELSIFASIKKLPAGHLLVHENGEFDIIKYWDLDSNVSPNAYSLEENLERLEYKVEEAVRLRMIADVPLGVFLSGGVDSSLVACMMARNSSLPIKTFSIGFSDKKKNELSYARQVADHIGSEHYEYVVEPDALEVVQSLVDQFDEPFADSSAIPQFYVSKMARQHVTVALGGDGGDELFGGYKWYTWVKQGVDLSHKLGALAGPASSLGTLLPNFMHGRHFLERLNKPAAGQYTRRIGYFNESERTQLFTPQTKSFINISLPEKRTAAWFDYQGDVLHAMQRLDFYQYLPDDILTKVDRTSMLVSLEARVPLLDHQLVEFAFSLPIEQRIHAGKKKYILKLLAKKFLPPDFPLERKQGFSIPLAKWIKTDIQPMFRQIRSSQALWTLLDRNYVDQLCQEHLNGHRDRSPQLWAVLCFGLWFMKWEAGFHEKYFG